MVTGSRDPQGTATLIRDVVLMGVLTLEELGQAAGFAPQSIDLVASVHPRGWVPGAIAEGLGLSSEQAPHTYARYAHLGGAGAVANLTEARRNGQLRVGSHVVLYAQGAGL